ncbi:4-diphosphocytidyl-2-C-methyl-D-erythritol kinase [Litorimonas taeanensis]|uniref:4-diphosphocytidyl-2-C-methyl-D-erythritol kinase n=1 Tax=Litorimonas taeanensis TaxID=568099 RepID=A0A420WJ86_9PROT|nr:4-(cytidine 5'-diphospho)-2-C-methyl-D-erythritol kinase [Litorimonas taeanensis]RKQ70996.1 4-diphosphocytidyl-2-C-methyl-D-erythritol kinase [Litorimonas taeanensis]
MARQSQFDASVLARAKINLTLHVGQAFSEGDYQGYHPVDSLVVFADFGDLLHFNAGEPEAIHITGPFAAGLQAERDNLVSRALGNTKAGSQIITLEKNIPVSAGLGGGSANAAAILRFFDPKGEASAIQLGADVPVCRLSETALMQGIGERVTPIAGKGQVHAVLVNPGVAVSTSEIFKAFDSVSHQPQPLPSLTTGTLLECARAGRNDLEPIAIKLAPVISEVLSALAQTSGCELARMSGSGATCFGLYPDEESAENGAKVLKGLHTNWWVRSCLLGDDDTNP